MASYRLLNERSEPLVGAPVEAISESTGQIIGRAVTDQQGVANFPSLAPTGWYPRANITRHSGKSGEMSNTGQKNFLPNQEPTLPPPPIVPLPTTPPAREIGMVRYFGGMLEYWNGAAWVNFDTLPITSSGSMAWLEC